MTITSRTNHRRNALRCRNPLIPFLIVPDMLISRPDRVSIGRGWRGSVETGAIIGQVESRPSIIGKTLSEASIDGSVGSKP